MQHLRTLIRLLIILYLIFFITNTVSATTRGIHVVSKKGKELYLYKDYHALVVGWKIMTTGLTFADRSEMPEKWPGH